MCQAVTKKILDGAEHCDIYTPFTSEERSNLTDNFLRFMEQFINKIKRAQYPKKQRVYLFFIILNSLHTVFRMFDC